MIYHISSGLDHHSLHLITRFIDPFKANDKWCRSERIDLWGIYGVYPVYFMQPAHLKTWYISINRLHLLNWLLYFPKST